MQGADSTEFGHAARFAGQLQRMIEWLSTMNALLKDCKVSWAQAQALRIREAPAGDTQRAPPDCRTPAFG